MGTGSRVRYRAAVEHSGDIIVVSLHGDVDVSTEADARRDLYGAVQSHPAGVILDLSDVAFIDSTGLGVLIGMLRRLNAHDVPLALVVTGAGIARIFSITRLDQVFPITGSVAAARRLVARPRS